MLTAVPVIEALTGGAGEPTGKGLVAKSDGLMPPAAVIVPASAVGRAWVCGTVGKFAAYCIAVVACAGMNHNQKH